MTTIQCDSQAALKQEINSLRPVLIVTETEESWDSIANGILHLASLSKMGACNFPDEFIASIRSLSRPLTSAMCSERGRLSGAAIDFLVTLASDLGGDMEALLPLFFPTLLTLCTRRSNIFVNRARACIIAFIENTQLPSILPYLADGSKDKSVSLRLAATESVLACLNCFNPPDLEKEARAKIVEDVIRVTARDASADVRKASRKVFEAYKTLLPGRVDKFIAPLTPVMKKYLEIKPSKSADNIYSTHMLSDGKNNMPPPKQLPARRIPPARPPITLSRSASSIEDKKCIAFPIPTSSKYSGPSRPPSVDTVAPELAVRSPASPGTTLEAQHFQTTKGMTLALGGATRLTRSTNETHSNNGPIRPRPITSQSAGGYNTRETDVSGKVRVMGGARRVPLPPPAHEDSQEMTYNPRSTSHSTANAGRSTATSQNAAVLNPAFKPGASKATEKAKPVPRPVIKPSSKIAQASSLKQATAKPPLPKMTRSVTNDVRREGFKQAGVTQPTLAQLSRAKATVADRKDNTIKPVWGRPAPSKGTSVTKSLAIKSKVQAVKALTHPVNTAPESVPLPPSPKREKTSTSTPLPRSPTPPASDEKEEEISLTDASNHVCQPVALSTVVTDDDTTSTPSIIPAVLEPTESTPTLAHSRPAAPAVTPISTLLSSIQQGFLFTPCSPLSPPQSYLPLTSNGDDDMDSPTPSARPAEVNFHQHPAGYFMRDLSVMPADENISDTITALENAKAVDDGTRQALGDVEVNQ